MKNNKLADAIGLIKDDFVEEAHAKKKFRFVVPWALIGKIACGAAVLLLVISIIPFGRKGSNAADQYYANSSSYEYKSDGSAQYAYDEEAGGAYAGGNTHDYRSESTVSENKKLILTARMNVETKDLDELLSGLNETINKYGAYIQSSTVNTSGSSTRQYDATIRIPSDRYGQFLEELKNSGNVSYYSEETKDVTDSYTDLQARLKSLKAEEEKVLEFYDKAVNLEELMLVEERLSEIRYEIEYLEAQIKNYDLLVAYSTLTIHVTETSSYTQTSTSFGERLARAFKNGFHDFIYTVEDIVIDLAYDIYGIIFIILLVVLGIFLYRKFRNRKNKN
ncbi:MAG: DUF4349 domain-containing protein [Erysipelotrichaceae bacterium]|nr:DUF4349 domain-containing protein [Erysipelotrichaceae bacterium]